MLLKTYNINYANHLLRQYQKVLRADATRGDSPVLEVHSNDKKELVFIIKDGLLVEDMKTNPSSGAKDRFDFHIDIEILTELNVLVKEYNEENRLLMDTSSFNIYDPTGTEHAHGLKLGDTKPIATIPSEVEIYYNNEGIVAYSNRIYIDAEKYTDKIRYHIGASTINKTSSESENKIVIRFSKDYLVRFQKSMEVALILLGDD